MINYPIAIMRDEGMDNYGAVIPDVPGCLPCGDTIDETIIEAQSLLIDHIEVTLDENLPFDFTSSKIEDLQSDPEYKDVIAWAYVSIDETKLATKQTRFNVSWSEYMLNRVDAHIAKTHDTRSGFLAKAAQRVLDEA